MRPMLVLAAAIGILAAPFSSIAQETTLQSAAPPSAPAAQPSTQTGGVAMQKCDTKAPMNVSSDAFEGDIATKVGTYTGNVIVIQTVCKLRADKVNVNIVEGKPDKVYAYGNVVFVNPCGTATGDNGVYDLGSNPPTITLTGKVVLTKEKNVMRGTKLVVNTDTGVAHVTSIGAQGGRVQSTLQPQQKQANATKKRSAGGNSCTGS
ncbi:MAG: LptA/OstA family protein [Rhizomicrobium sp.]